ncbi:MAG: S8 family serine peptidase, partial [Acidimicrobiia bacterium]
TSASAPYVAGVAALLKSFRPQLTNEDIEQVLKLTATNLGPPGFDDEYGWGLVRADTALMEVAAPKSIMRLRFGPGPFSIGPLQVQGTEPVLVTFVEVSKVLHGRFPCTRYRLIGSGNLPFPFTQTPRAWVRAATSMGARNSDTLSGVYEVPFGQITSVSATSVAVETFVYWVGGEANTWYPSDPAGARVDLTAIGQIAGTVGVGNTGGEAKRDMKWSHKCAR